jgi:tetratricopeptide (TPR) repeat protein
MARVFEHNRQDIVSLAALAVLACQWVEDGRAEDPRDVYSLARVLERARQYERSEVEYLRALELGAGTLKGPALLRLAWRAKRAGDHLRAARLWERAGEAGEPEGWRELAMHHEHRTRDLDAALEAVERGLRLVAEGRDTRSWHLAKGFRHRRERLERKKARRETSRREEPPTAAPSAGTPRDPGSAPAS